MLGAFISFGQIEMTAEDSLKEVQRNYLDSLLQLEPSRELNVDFYKERYDEKDLMYKITDNKGDGFDSLYGTRNMRTILHGVAYRGGANNYYHKEAKRNNHNPLPNDGIRNLCREGFSASIYLYRENFDTAPLADTCDCVNGAWNGMKYYQFDYYDSTHIYEMMRIMYESATTDSVGPVYLHCWNGWHASGLLSALALRQFCGYDKWEAINYWDLGTDGANNSPRYQRIREMIKDFEPYPEFIIKDELGNRICPPMPEILDSAELYVDVEQLVYVPESMPIGFEIVLHNVSFGAGQSSFSNPGENKDVQNLLQALNDQPELKLELGGYTDNTGSAAKNVEISAKRAKFIYDYLISQGIAQERLSYKGYGPEKPLYSNRYSSTREGNRRIEVKITDKKKEDYSKLVEEAIDDDRNKTSMLPEPTLADLLAPVSVVPVNQPIVISSIVYEPNMIEVPEAAKADLNELAGWMRMNPTFKLEVSSHTDKSGLEELNELLSTQRAEAVYNYLVEQGAPKEQLTFKGYGSSKPIASNKYQHGKEKNRRVEIKILEIVE